MNVPGDRNTANSASPTPTETGPSANRSDSIPPITRLPRIIGVQAAVCAPLYSAYNAGLTIPEPSQEGKTLAEGVAISTPYHGKEVLRAVRESEGIFLTVEEDQIRAGHKNLAHMGIHTELTSALVWNALEQLGPEYPDPIVSVITGHGLKGI